MANFPAANSSVRELFPIRTVCSMTGVNPITLRAWERRYGFIKPTRTPSGHRMYRREDIELIHRVVSLLDRGIPVGQVKKSLRGPAPEQVPGNQPWVRYQERMIAAITRFDEDELEACYNDMLAMHPIEQVTLKLLVPLLEEIGRRWESAEGSVAEEHFFAVYLRNKLGARFHHRARHRNGIRILVACLPGEQHEVGLLLFSLSANEHGFNPVLLGANTPLQELSQAVRRANCRAIVLAGSQGLQPVEIDTHLPALVASAGVPVFVGGLTAMREHAGIARARAIPLGTDIIRGIERIHTTLSAPDPHHRRRAQ